MNSSAVAKSFASARSRSPISSSCSPRLRLRLARPRFRSGIVRDLFVRAPALLAQVGGEVRKGGRAPLRVNRVRSGWLLPRALGCSLLATAQVGAKTKSVRSMQTLGEQAI